VCIKRARSKLRVAADWRVSVERNAYEVSWMQMVNEVAPGTAPRILAHEPKMGLFIMDYLDPDTFRLWKEELRKGRAESSTAGAVGDRLARIAALTANAPAIALRFASDDIFKAIRLEPYLEAAARAHPDRAAALLELIESMAKTKRALVHGDVSPKNILIGSDGPVFLDAECAWYGDPAFDLAFCLNHLLLKCVWVPTAKSRFLECFARLADAYRAKVTWEPVQNIEKRAARLVPGLLLARVDGKSPVEYLVGEHDKNSVRRVARTLLAKPVDTLDEVRAAWSEELRG
jgi:5-methylthioribose kinase